MNSRFVPGTAESVGLTIETLPKHVAIIMDGNGRYALKRHMPRAFGHRAGVERLRGIIRMSSDLGIEVLTLYAFSTENWKRPKEEVDALCRLFVEFFTKEFDEMHENGVRIRALGDTLAFPEKVSNMICTACERTERNDGLQLNIAMNYGSRAEIVRAVNAAVEKGETVTESTFKSLLYTADQPDVDCMIRTGGEIRISNFLLYQCAYAEMFFTDDYWPDFSNERYIEILNAYAHRNRRFGGLNT